MGLLEKRKALHSLVSAVLLAGWGVFRVNARSVNVGLTAGGWRDSPAAPILEAAEFLAEEGDARAEKMWKYIELFGSDSELSSSAANVKSHTDARELVDDAVGSMNIGILSERLLEASLYVRAHLPAVEMQYTQAELTMGVCTNSAWAVVLPFGAVACTANELNAAVIGECNMDDAEAGSPGSPGTCPQIVDGDQPQERIYDTDHVYPTSLHSSVGKEESQVSVIVYGRLATPEFYALHEAAKRLLETNSISKYAFRHSPPTENETTTPLLQGYGIWLDIKNMEYKNLDEASTKSEGESQEDEKVSFTEGEEIGGLYFSTLLERKPELARELKMLRTTLLEESTDKQDELKVWNMGDLGIQATQSIVQAQDPLKRFQDISQNFPLHASSLSSLKASEELREEVMYNMQVSSLLRSNEASLYINGQHVDCGRASFNFFQALEAVRQENKQLSELVTMGVPPSIVSDLLLQGQMAQNDDSIRINVRKDSKGALLFLNNIEKDKMYKSWSTQIEMLVYPSWQPHRLRYNLYTMVILLDPSDPQDLESIEMITYLHQNQFPVRLALVLAGRTDLSKVRSGKPLCSSASTDLQAAAEPCQISSLFLFGKEEYGMSAAMNFLMQLSIKGTEEGFEVFKIQDVIDAFGQGIRIAKGKWSAKTISDAALQHLNDLNAEKLEKVEAMARYISRKGLTTGMLLFNGIPNDDLNFGGTMMQMLMMEQSMLGEMLMAGEIQPNTKNFLEKILKYHGAHDRWHPMLAEDADEAVYAPLHVLDNVALTTGTFNYVYHTNDSHEDPSSLTLHVISDFGSESGLELMDSAMQYMSRSRSRGTRLAFVHHSNKAFPGISKLVGVVGALFANSFDVNSGFWAKVLEMVKHEDIISDAIVTKLVADLELGTEAEKVALQACGQALDDATFRQTSGEIAQKVFKVKPGASAVFANGRKVEVSDEIPFVTDDFQILAGMQQPTANGILDFLTENNFEGSTDELSDLAMRLGGFLAMYWAQDAYDVPNELTDTMRAKSFVSMNPEESEEEETSLVTITAAVNPLSKGAQRLAPMLTFFRDQLGLPVRMVFMPSLDVTELPFKNFYRFVLSLHGSEPHAKFTTLPPQHILTARLDTPEIWNVQASKAIQDMDNLRCDSTVCGDDGSTVTNVEYNLKNMIVVGQCYDWKHKTPPNGLQLVLNRPGDNTPFSDTLVMKNLGYYQLKARPGIWHLNLAEGKAQDLYNPIDRDTSQILNEVPVIVRDFQTKMNFLAVAKRPGMEDVSLLDDGSEDSGYWSSVTSFFGGSAEKSKEDDTIHVFSLATGHLYERMLKIMMLSVVKRTSMKVKFWLFENFLSPTFKDSALAMAEEAGFEVDFVTYKWPEWLRHQSEKQRIIWGYKILFLDVLFPLNVKKVIYVDADQVVRADLKELWEMNLKGRPYAYTPFCSSREETLGYQFWNSGFWRDHLRGRPYHISALYVVDLQVFRRMMVGDQLRGTYDALSRDPNSLANLDQDLPNYAQHQIPIFSLPQEWLWCESWCSDSSKASAKTIDLCNNPQHKEPKLDMARRVISGDLFQESWIELDEEVKAIEKAHNLTAQH